MWQYYTCIPTFQIWRPSRAAENHVMLLLHTSRCSEQSPDCGQHLPCNYNFLLSTVDLAAILSKIVSRIASDFCLFQFDLQLVNNVYPVMTKDALLTSHAISTPIIDPNDIPQFFDQISYDKVSENNETRVK